VRGLKTGSDNAQAGFFRVELALSSTLADIAETNFKNGNFQSAKRALRNAQQGVSTVQAYLKDPKHARHLTGKEQKEALHESERLQDRLNTLTAHSAHGG
jgi:hypothetical protein